LGIVFWTFFTEATNQGLASIVRQADLIRKINFPKYIIVISGSLSAFINLLINLVVIAVFVVITGVPLGVSALLFPLYIIELYILALSLAFILSAVYVKYRDVSHIWEIILQAAFYATPILYPLTLVVKEAGPFVAQLLLLNPVAQIIQDARHALVTTQTVTMSTLTDNPLFILAPFSIVIGLMLFAVHYFKKNSAYFSENV
jgi:ABC-2 type transport system permease protein